MCLVDLSVRQLRAIFKYTLFLKFPFVKKGIQFTVILTPCHMYMGILENILFFSKYFSLTSMHFKSLKTEHLKNSFQS